MASTNSVVAVNLIFVTSGESNITWNSSRGGDDGEEIVFLSRDTMDILHKITTPVICLVGTILNLLTVGVFLSRPLRHISCCLYLATRSLAVVGFLVSITIAWSNSIAPLMNTEGVCEITVFLSYFCPFISVWMMVTISVENFVRIAQPSRVGKFCTPRVAKSVIVVFVMLGLAVYNIPLWTSRVIRRQCEVLSQFRQTVLVLNNIDAVLTLFCPFVLMITIVPLIALSAMSAYERKKRLVSGSDSFVRNRQQATECKSSPESRVTRLLLAVSLVFLVLHTPFHVIRTKVFILTLTYTAPSRMDVFLMHVFRLLYNLDTCASCAVYLIFGDNFRKVFYKMYFSRCHLAKPHLSGATTKQGKWSDSTETNVSGNDRKVDDRDETKTNERLLSVHNL